MPLDSKSHTYADNTTFFISETDSAKLQQLDHHLSMIQNWCKNSGMSIKSIRNTLPSHQPSENFTLTLKLGNHVLGKKDNSKLLGFTINDF